MKSDFDRLIHYYYHMYLLQYLDKILSRQPIDIADVRAKWKANDWSNPNYRLAMIAVSYFAGQPNRIPAEYVDDMEIAVKHLTRFINKLATRCPCNLPGCPVNAIYAALADHSTRSWELE